MIEVMKFKAELVSKIDISFFSYELRQKNGKSLANMAYRPLPVILGTSVGDLEYDQ